MPFIYKIKYMYIHVYKVTKYLGFEFNQGNHSMLPMQM